MASLYAKEYYINNKEAITAKNKEYALKNIEKIRKYGKEYRAKNKDRRKTVGRNYYLNNKEEFRVKGKKYRERPEIKLRNKKNSAEYYKQNKEGISLKSKTYREKHKVGIKKYHDEWYNSRGKGLVKEGVDNLEDLYVRNLITKRSALSGADVPQELVEAKRQEMQVKRIIKGE